MFPHVQSFQSPDLKNASTFCSPAPVSTTHLNIKYAKNYKNIKNIIDRCPFEITVNSSDSNKDVLLVVASFNFERCDSHVDLGVIFRYLGARLIKGRLGYPTGRHFELGLNCNVLGF